MAIRLKVDEDLPSEVAGLLRNAGHDACTVTEQRLSGTPDSTLWDHVQHEQRCLLTADKGFANAQLHPPGTHEGVILLRLPRESRAAYIHLVQSLLANLALESVKGSLVVVTPQAIRIHRGT